MIRVLRMSGPGMWISKLGRNEGREENTKCHIKSRVNMETKVQSVSTIIMPFEHQSSYSYFS